MLFTLSPREEGRIDDWVLEGDTHADNLVNNKMQFSKHHKVIVNRNGWAIVSPALPCSVLHWEFLQGPKYRVVCDSRQAAMQGSRRFNALECHIQKSD